MINKEQGLMNIFDMAWAIYFGGISQPLQSPFWTAVDQAWRLSLEQYKAMEGFLAECVRGASPENRDAVHGFYKLILSRVKIRD